MAEQKESLTKKWWKGLPSEGKKKATQIFVLGGLIIVFGIGYKLRSEGVQPKGRREMEKTISLDPNLLQRSAIEESRQKSKGVVAQLTVLQKQLEKIEKEGKRRREQEQREIDELKKQLNRKQVKKQNYDGRLTGVFKGPSPTSQASTQQRNINGAFSSKKDLENPDRLGGIVIVTNHEVVKAQKEKPDKKKEIAVYLPPSFMEATLLSGLDAPTIENAKSHPMPALLRVKAPAVLPNKVKANLKGCFVIAEGHGDLASERVYLRLVYLSCLSKDGQSVIDEKVKGFVVDEDGKIGLKGKVVSKMGSAIARTMIAGFFGGIGDALQRSALTTSVNPLGTTQTLDANKMFEVGAGSGLAMSMKEVQKFYLDLARQTMPVIEVGAVKNVTLVISEGTKIMIKEHCVDMGAEGCAG